MRSISRRKFGRSTLSMLAGSAFLGGISPAGLSRLEAATAKSVVIIGAGMSGIAAARELVARNYRVTILEARNRVGGRIQTASVGGQAVDLGAQWIEGITGNPIYRLCTQLKLPTVLSNRDSYAAYDIDGRRYATSTANTLYARASRIINATEAISQQGIDQGLPDVTFAKGLAQTGLGTVGTTAQQKRFLQWAVSWEGETSDAEDAERLSLRYYWDDETPDTFSGPDHVLPGGYGQLVAKLAAGLDIRMNMIVSEVAYDSTGVTVKTAAGATFNANYCLVTLPLGVLKANVVKFTPALPASKLTAIQKLGVGLAHKTVLRFGSNGLPTEQFLGFTGVNKGQFVEWTNISRYTPAPILGIWSHGDAARRLELMTPQDTVNLAMTSTKLMFPNIGNPTVATVTNWGADPFSRGAYSTVPLGATSAMLDVLAQPVGRTLYFAGEATERQHQATVHGAYLSGLREALRIAAIV